MPQIPINPGDNDRLKTRKVNQMLDDLGVLPADHSLRPTFLCSRRAASVLIDRALDGLALDPSARKHCCKNSEEFVAAINSKFAAAYMIDVGNGPVGPSLVADFLNLVYLKDGAATTLDNILAQDTEWDAFDPATGIDQYGLIGSPVVAGDAYAQLQEGATIIVQFTLNSVVDGGATGGRVNLDYHTRNSYNTEFWVFLENQPVSADVTQFGGGDTNLLWPDGVLNAGQNKVALTVVPGPEGRLSWSINGGAAQTSTVAGVDWASNAPDVFGIDVTSTNEANPPDVTRVQTFAVYPAQADADLPTLSALA